MEGEAEADAGTAVAEEGGEEEEMVVVQPDEVVVGANGVIDGVGEDGRGFIPGGRNGLVVDGGVHAVGNHGMEGMVEVDLAEAGQPGIGVRREEDGEDEEAEEVAAPGEPVAQLLR